MLKALFYMGFALKWNARLKLPLINKLLCRCIKMFLDEKLQLTPRFSLDYALRDRL